MYKESKAAVDSKRAYNAPMAKVGQVVVIYDAINKEYVQRKIGLAYTKEGKWSYVADPRHNPAQKVESAFEDVDIEEVLRDTM
jgi:hypothetical protein